MGIVVIGAAFMDIKGFPQDIYIPDGRNVGRIEFVHGGVARNVVEDIANMELRPTDVGSWMTPRWVRRSSRSLSIIRSTWTMC